MTLLWENFFHGEKLKRKQKRKEKVKRIDRALTMTVQKGGS
ncbi:hypothetical protein V6Z11_A02G112300 [Gossypium hirsutum]